MNKGFYGLVASGIDIADFENKEKIRAKNLPEESQYAELIVNLLLTERSDNRQLEDFNQLLQESTSQRGLNPFTLQERQLLSIRNGIDDLLNRWTFLPVDQALILTFPEL